MSAEWDAAREEIIKRLGDCGEFFKDLQKQENNAGEWKSACCPFHEETDPSFSYSVKTGGWKCFAGCGKGSLFDYLMRRTGKTFPEVLEDLASRTGVQLPKSDGRPPIREELIDQWQAELWRDGSVVQFLREKRGFSDETIKRFKIGWDPKRQRNTLPIRDKRGNVVNVRLYNAKKKPKMINYTEGKHKYGSPARLIGAGMLSKLKPGDEVIICEGEWDAILARQEGFNAVSGTHGATTFRDEWREEFKGLNVVVMYDCDAEGQAAAHKVVMPALKGYAAAIKNVVLPLKGAKDDKDVTDYLHVNGHTAADLRKLIDETPVHVFEEDKPKEVETIALDSFTDIVREDMIGKRVKTQITVCGETLEDFHAVKSFQIEYCPRMAKGGCFECKGASGTPHTLPPGSQEYISSCMSSNNYLKNIFKDYACKYGQKCVIDFKEQVSLKEFFCHQKVARMTHQRERDGSVVQMLDGKKQELMEKKVYFLSDEQPRPASYEIEGFVQTHPKTQQVTMLIDKMKLLDEDYQSFDLEKSIPLLKAFRDIPLSDLVADLNENVTRIYDRDALLVATLLTYCSPRWIKFNEEIIRGWLVTCIVGDAGSGKTQTSSKISNFIQVGDIFSGLTGSRTGLAYALVEHKQRGWQIKVGRYPANSRKLLMIDEVQHIDPLEMRTLAKAMEEGFLQIDRVQSKGYESQTRLLMIANPRKDEVMDSFSFGALSLGTVFPPTIIRRMDICCFANASDLADLSIINRRNPHDHAKRVTPEMLRTLVYWAWNLTHEDVIFKEGAVDRCLHIAEEMSKKYGYATKIPLVTISDFRNKLARVAAAMAVLTVSVEDETFKKVVVTRDHINMAANFFEGVYDNDNCGLKEYSNVERDANTVTDYEKVAAAFLKKVANGTHSAVGDHGYFPRIVYHLRVNSAVRREDIVEQIGCSKDTVQDVVNLLRKYNLLESTKDGYVKKPKFNKFMRRFLKENENFFEKVGEELETVETQDLLGDSEGPF